MSVYKVRHITDTVYVDGWRDGVRAQQYSVDGLIHVTGGWDDHKTPILVSSHYTLNPQTLEIKKLPDAPWQPRHTHGFGEWGGKLWVWGYKLQPNGAMDVWSWTQNEGWLRVSDGWQFPNLTHSNYCIYKDHLYVAGGYLDDQIPNIYYDIVATFDLRNPQSGWTKICDLPDFLKRAAAGNIVPFKGDLIHIGGGEVFVNGNRFSCIPNTKIGKSTDNGGTWQQVADQPFFLNSGIWGNAAANDEAIFFNSGSDSTSSMTANNRLVVTYDLVNFEYLDKRLPTRHAAAMCVDDKQNVHVIMGNGCNDWWMIKKIA